MEYTPINCNFYDELEALATLRKVCEVTYQNGESMERATGIIEDLWNKDKVEYMRMSGGEVIRLDHLLSVDGKSPGSYC